MTLRFQLRAIPTRSRLATTRTRSSGNSLASATVSSEYASSHTTTSGSEKSWESADSIASRIQGAPLKVGMQIETVGLRGPGAVELCAASVCAASVMSATIAPSSWCLGTRLCFPHDAPDDGRADRHLSLIHISEPTR